MNKAAACKAFFNTLFGSCLILFFFLNLSPAKAQENEKAKFFIPARLKKTALATAQVYKGFYLKEEKFKPLNSGVSILINFEGDTFEMQALKDAASLEEAKHYIDQNLNLLKERDIEVKELPLFYLNKVQSLFWVGDKSFLSLKEVSQALKGLTAQDITEEVTDKQEVTVKQVVQEEKAGEKKEEVTKKEKRKVKEDLVKLGKFIKPFLEIEYMSYGDTTYRKSGMSRRGLDSFVGWWEHRVAFTGYRLWEKGGTLNLYFKINLEMSSNNNAWENKFIYGVGLEYRPLSNCESLKGSFFLNWLPDIRCYAEFLNFNPLKSNYANKTYDRRVGMDLYKEYNFIDNYAGLLSWKDYFWGEVWSDFSYRTTNFSDDERYKSLMLSINGKLGIYLPKLIKFNVMPYVFFDGAVNEQQFFWENRMQQGLGLRITPFRNERFKAFEWLYGLRVFAEYHDNIKYFKDSPDNTTPSSDVRVGIGYSYNRH